MQQNIFIFSRGPTLHLAFSVYLCMCPKFVSQFLFKGRLQNCRSIRACWTNRCSVSNLKNDLHLVRSVTVTYFGGVSWRVNPFIDKKCFGRRFFENIFNMEFFAALISEQLSIRCSCWQNIFHRNNYPNQCIHLEYALCIDVSF